MTTDQLIALLWAAGAATWIAGPLELRAELLWGRSCPFNIAGLSLPLLLALLVALRGLAPTRPALFVAVWYVLGMAVAPAAGALLGPRVLRW